MLKEHFPAVLAEGQPPEPSKRPGTSNTVYYASRTSVDPSHISLNLCIHTFVEACRTVPLPYNLEQTSSASRPSAPGTSRLSNLDPSSSLAQGSVTRDEAELADLVLRAQKLHAAVHMLHKASDREMYGEELKRVCSLLAYPVPESSPMCRYLGQARREAVADQINSAILCEYFDLPPALMEIWY